MTGSKRTLTATAFLVAAIWGSAHAQTASDPDSGQAASSNSARTAQLVYERAPTARRCPDEQAIRDRVAARLGYDPFVDASPRTVRVQLRAREDSSGHRARIEFGTPDTDSPGVRTLNSADPSCEDLVDALIFTVTVAIDPSSIGPRAQESPGDPRRAVMGGLLRAHDAYDAARQAQSEAAARLEAPPEDTSTAEASRTLDLRAAAGGGLLFGAAPKPAGLVRLQLEAGRAHWSIGVAGSATLPVRETLSTGSMETSMLLAELSPCGRYRWFRGCGLLVAGSLRTTGMGLRKAASNSHFYAATGARVGAEIPVVGPMSVRLHAQFAATLARTRVLVGGKPVWRTPDLTAGVGTAVVFDFL